MDDALSLAERLFAAIEAGDIDGVRAVYDPDVVVWNTMSGVDQTRDENLATLTWCVEHLAGMRYTEVRRQRTEDGFVQQHVLRATAPDGSELVVPACLVVTVSGGLITRLDEYLNAAHLAALTR
jgi:ketosteroid isomerase-like protein